jgi:hypothetical protein
MTVWEVRLYPDFVPEFRALPAGVKVQLGDVFDHLRERGAFLGRPEVDTLKGSIHVNMKEIRLATASNWYRFAFAFDPRQRAIILCGGDKGGISQELFYGGLIRIADARFSQHLENLKSG